MTTKPGKKAVPEESPTIFTLGEDVLSRLKSLALSADVEAGTEDNATRLARPSSASPAGSDDESESGSLKTRSVAKSGGTDAGEDEKRGATCASCRVSFESQAEQRQHYKMDWHRYNVKRRLKSASAASLTEDEFETRVQKDGNLSDGSLSGSDSEDSEDGDAEDQPDNGFDGGLDSKQKSPFVVINVPLAPGQAPVLSAAEKGLIDGTNPNLAQSYQIYRTVLYNPRTTQETPSSAELAAKLQQFTMPATNGNRRLWTFLLLSSGHLAFAVIDPATMQTIVHTTKHRYTVRRKQGGAQSGADGGRAAVAHSAGAGLRRYNEQMLREEVREVLKDHEQLLDESEIIFVQASGSSNQRVIFGYKGAVLRRDDERVRSIPFTTKRPTFSECERCAKELRTIKVNIVDLEAARREREADAARQAAKEERRKAAEAKPEKAVKEEKKIDFEAEKLVDLISRGKLDLVEKLLESTPELLRERFPVTPLNPTALHLAASSGQGAIVQYLLTSHPDVSDPTVTNSRKQTPYDGATDKEARNAFRRVRAIADFTTRWDWKNAHVPEALTPEMEEAQKKKEQEKKAKEEEREKESKEKELEKERIRAAEERKKKEAADAEKAKKAEMERKKLANVPSSSATQGSYKLAAGPKVPTMAADTLTPEARARIEREKRALAAEWRMRATTGKCPFCGKALNTLVGTQPVERMGWKYCSMNCLNEHRQYT